MRSVLIAGYLLANLVYLFVFEKRDIHVFCAIQVIALALLLG